MTPEVLKMVVGGLSVSQAAADRLGFSRVPRRWSQEEKISSEWPVVWRKMPRRCLGSKFRMGNEWLETTERQQEPK